MTDNAQAPDPRPQEISGQVADSDVGNWVDIYAPVWARPYLRLSRADRPVGTWLLLIPCLWGAFLAAGTQAPSGALWGRTLWVILGCALGAWLMRGAGCTWNDIADRHIDGSVERTKSRPLPSGQVTTKQAAAWMILQCVIAFAILLSFNTLTIMLGILSLAPVALYPFAKRFTWWPQVFLGLAFNWGALLAYAAVANELTSVAVFLYLAGIAWTLFYDTIYAHQDRDDDALIGVKSTARLFGTDTSRWLKRFLIATTLLLAAAALEALSHRSLLSIILGLGGAVSMAAHLSWQLKKLDINNADLCLGLFRSNRNAGLWVTLFFACASLL